LSDRFALRSRLFPSTNAYDGSRPAAYTVINLIYTDFEVCY